MNNNLSGYIILSELIDKAKATLIRVPPCNKTINYLR